MAEVGFAKLPDDVLQSILDFVVANTDVLSLLLTSRRLYNLSIKRLYHTVTLDVGTGDDKYFISMLNAHNQGLKHIRVLDLSIEVDGPDERSALGQSQFILGMFLEVVPPDTLEELVWRSWEPITAENMKRLCTTQKKLKRLEAGSIQPAFDDKSITDWNFDACFENIEEFGFYIDSQSALKMSAEMLQRLRNPLKKLVLFCNWGGGDLVVSEMNDSATRPGHLTSTLFKHMLPFEKAKALGIEDLHLIDINLRHPRDTFCRVLRLSNLSRLVLEKCRGADVFLGELCRSTMLPSRLKTFVFLHQERMPDDAALTAVEDFLSLLQGLIELVIDIMHVSRLPQVSKIVPLAGSLRLLSIHAYKDENVEADLMISDDEHVYSRESFGQLLPSLTEVEELSLAAPGREISERKDVVYRRFMESFVGSGSKMDKLHTLQITTWPTCPTICGRMSRGMYDALLKVHAMEFFNARHTSGKLPMLHLIEWGSEDYYRKKCMKSGSISTIFVRNTESTPDGKQRPSCISVVPEWRLNKLSLPTRVLSMSLAKHAGPPARDRGKEDSDSGNVPLGWKMEREDDSDSD